MLSQDEAKTEPCQTNLSWTQEIIKDTELQRSIHDIQNGEEVTESNRAIIQKTGRNEASWNRREGDS
jgi:hypothetical protein